MDVIAVANQKGGVGKTTLTSHIAVEAVRKGVANVAMLDLDPQGSLTAWWNARQDAMPQLGKVDSPSGLMAYLEAMRQGGCKLVVIDTPPSVHGFVADVLRAADLVVVPVQPSPHDLRAVSSTVSVVREAGRPLVFVINAASKRARLTGQSAIALSQHGTIAPSIIGDRVDFAASAVDGRTVQELDDTCPSAIEVGQLWDYLQDQLQQRATH